MYFPPLDQAYPMPTQMTHDDYSIEHHTMPTREQVKTPMLPLLGNLSHSQMVDAVMKAIIGEATAIDFYSRLQKEATNPVQREFIREALYDEQKHLHAFTKLYVYLTGKQPVYQIQPVQVKTYREGLLYAMKDELEARSFYAEMMLSTTDQLIIDTFSFAMHDEIEHAITFSFSYNQMTH
jgi:rubrerythrin